VSGVLPAVSGSSGRLVVSEPAEAKGERDWPGRVFEREGLTYKEAMDQFIVRREAASKAKGEAEKQEVGQDEGEAKAQRRALRAEDLQLRVARGKERVRGRLSDAAWKERKKEHLVVLASLEGAGGERRGELGHKRAAVKAQYHAEWVERHRALAGRRQENVRWRQEREKLRQRQQALGTGRVMAWIAVLVIVDNCTRRCLGLPLFAMGAHVTAELVTQALRVLLPKELRYLISDGGTHFTADVLKELAQSQGFVRVPLARHRPQSNGIAERFIETLKAWLADKEWQTVEELEALLAKFLAYYNDRPHQGRELRGLSPNEYASRAAAA
jgi:transposase InsO family protein